MIELNIEKVREYMQLKSWSEKDLSEKMQVDYTTVYRVLRGERNPGPKFINGILRACVGLEFNEIFLTQSLPTGNNAEA